MYYKAVWHDYGSFHDPSFKYGPAGTVVEHPRPLVCSAYPGGYLSVSTSPADCTGFVWRDFKGNDSRLLVVEPVGYVWEPYPDESPNLNAVTGLRVVDELSIAEAFGPNGEAVVALLDTLSRIGATQWAEEMSTAGSVSVNYERWHSFHVVSRVARIAGRSAALSAAMDAAGSAGGLAGALVVRYLIRDEEFNVLAEPWRAAGIVV